MRLDYNKARYDAGDRDPSQSEEAVTIGVLIDSINQWTNAVATEAQFKSTYNTSIAVLEEAKGTLLAYDNIALAEGPWPRKAYVQARDQQAAHRQHPVGEDGPYHPEPVTGSAVPDPVPVQPPPDLTPPGPIPALPAPGGNLGPRPRSVPPQIPAGEPATLSNLTTDPGATPATDDSSVLPASLPDLPERTMPAPAAETESTPRNLPPLPPASTEPRAEFPIADNLPPLPPG